MNAAHGALLSCAALAAMYLPVALFGMGRGDTTLTVAGNAPALATTGAAMAPVTLAAPAAKAVPDAPADDPAGGPVLHHAAPLPAEAPPALAAEAPGAGATPATREPAPSPTTVPAPALPLEKDQMVVFYGTPLASGLGILGMFDADEAAVRVKAQTAVFDELNGDRGAFGALDVIYALAQAEPTPNGLYVRYLKDATVQRYIDVAERHDVQLILDLQIGRGDILGEVRKIERFLLHPRVHVAIDPEYAVGPHGKPIKSPGRISGHQMNDVQRYIDDLVRAHDLPPKMVIVHQYMNATVTDGDVTLAFPNVDLVLNMDAFGKPHQKIERYHQFASRPYARRDGFNIFLKQDERVMSEQEVLDISPMPDVIFYQ